MRKRFIAGAQCPKCGVDDRIVTFHDEHDVSMIECVVCGYSQSEQDLAKPSTKEVTIQWPKKTKKP